MPVFTSFCPQKLAKTSFATGRHKLSICRLFANPVRLSFVTSAGQCPSLLGTALPPPPTSSVSRYYPTVRLSFVTPAGQVPSLLRDRHPLPPPPGITPRSAGPASVCHLRLSAEGPGDPGRAGHRAERVHQHHQQLLPRGDRQVRWTRYQSCTNAALFGYFASHSL